uniref:Otopetrin-2 isoform X2 n=1 Tax=Hirondellea gigas TaxID=1518452 RepID=A0A6A7FUR1_9CRUS
MSELTTDDKKVNLHPNNQPFMILLNDQCIQVINSESEASGSARVTPVQQRRRIVPKHPHRRGRKVSAPPELQPHLGPHSVHQPKKHTQGGAITDTADSSSQQTEYIINISSGTTNVSEGLYSGSDSGVTSEYSSWSVPVSGHQRQEQTGYEDENLTSQVGSADDLLNDNSRRHKDKYFTSDSESESVGLSSPLSSRRRGMNNAAYVTTEPRPLVLSVDGPPPTLSRSLTDSNLIGTPHNVIASPTSTPTQPGTPHRPRTNSMVVQLNLGNPQQERISSTSPPSNLRSARSVSLVSLNHPGVNTMPNVTSYPNLSNYGNDNQSIYSEIGGPQYGTGYLGTHHMNNIMGSQGSLAGYKDHGMGTISPAPMPPHDDHHEPEPTSEEEKKEWTLLTLADNLSLIYAIFLVTLGIVIYLADTFSEHDSAMAETFNVFLIVVQLLWLGYAHIDVRQYLKTIMKAVNEAKERDKDNTDHVVLEPTGDGQYQLRINLPEPRRTIPQHYGFTSGRHGGSLYLKIGATVFCFGHLIHSGLNLGQKILYLTADDPAFDNCTCTPDVIMSVLQPIYAFYNLFFVFKYSNLIINKRKHLSRFGLMHCIAASLCFWLYAILQETLQAIYAKKTSSNPSNYTTTVSPLSLLNYKMGGDDDDDSDEMDDDDDDSSNYNTYPSKTSTEWNINFGCEKSTELTEMINYTTPYLYPFSIEYHILIVGVWILLWENIGKTERHTHIPSIEVTYEEDNTKGFSSNMIIYVDCHSSNRGLFAGLLMTVATVISIILFFIFTSSQNNVALGLYVNGYSEMLLLIVMAIAGTFAYNSVRTLDVIKSHISSVDDILLIICLPCILLYAFFSMVPAVLHGNILFVSVNIMQVIQATMQTVLIGDGLRRCANSSKAQQKKPGREVITFLVVANVAMWLLETFEIKSDAGNADKYEFYGKNLWTMLSHLTLPLALFYRFHSSVCLADMWKTAYEEESEH